MPNHVHVVFQPCPEHALPDILHSWKSFTAKRANTILKREGEFWQREYYDHLVRDEQDLDRIAKYVAENPANARLRDWPWVWSRSAAVPAARSDTGSAAVPTASVEAGETPALQPEDVFHYFYAILYSPSYRARYGEFLKIDFPRVPLPANLALFRVLCRMGEELVKLHLLESPRPDTLMTRYPKAGSNIVESPFPRYFPAGEPEPGTGKPIKEGRVYINGTQYFAGVPAEVWEFHIGGYQVCEKWLKDRRGCALSYDDTQHYQKVVLSLSETIRLMGKIDGAIEAQGGWPLA